MNPFSFSIADFTDPQGDKGCSTTPFPTPSQNRCKKSPKYSVSSSSEEPCLNQSDLECCDGPSAARRALATMFPVGSGLKADTHSAVPHLPELGRL